MKGIKIFVDDMVYRMIQVYSCALSHNCYDNCSLYRISAKHYPLLLTCWMCYSVFVDVLVRWRRVFFLITKQDACPLLSGACGSFVMPCLCFAMR